MPNQKPEGLPVGTVDAVIRGLDDTLVVERPATEAAMAAACRHAATLRDVHPARLAQDVFEEAKSHWWNLPNISFAHQLGIASWEALWATFEGPGQDLAALRDVRLSNRQAVWRAATSVRRQSTIRQSMSCPDSS